LSVPVLKYAFGIINWHQEELQKLDLKKKEITLYGQHHTKAHVDHLYVPENREEGT
jgi:hypothetical protein